jgi:hypothetical protein
MGIDFNDAEGAEPEVLEEAKNGEETMRTTVSTDAEAMKLSNRGGGTGNDKSLDEVIRDSEQNLTKVRQIISQGGFSGPEKDKYELSLAHAEWVHARNIERKCDNDVRETSVKYTALMNGKAQTHEINKAHSEWKTKREICKKIESELFDKANKYIEVDRRVRQNKKAADEYPVTLSSTSTRERFQVSRGGGGGDGDEMEDVEGFTSSLKEGFNFYKKSPLSHTETDQKELGTNPSVKKYNVRLPLYGDTMRSIETSSTTILPWNEYYVDCTTAYPNPNDASKKTKCENANNQKDKYIKTINHEFDRADSLLNIYYNVSLKQASGGGANYINPNDMKKILQNQYNNIKINKQNATYDYDEYNSLSFYEDLALFLYYALFAIFVLMSLREFFSGGAYDKRNILILILLGIYPKYILTVVLWLLNLLTNIASVLGLRNIRFWNSAE